MIVCCNNEQEFFDLIYMVFFNDDRPRLYQGEFVNFCGEEIISFLKMNIDEDDESDITWKMVKDGNHGFHDLEYPAIVDWFFEKFGCESWAQEKYFNVHSLKDLNNNFAQIKWAMYKWMKTLPTEVGKYVVYYKIDDTKYTVDIEDSPMGLFYSKEGNLVLLSSLSPNLYNWAKIG